MQNNIFRTVGNALSTLVNGQPRQMTEGMGYGMNDYNRSFFQLIGGGYTSYDPDGKTYIEKGYNMSSIVYSIIQQMITKTCAIPYFIKPIEDEKALKNIKSNITNLSTKDPLQVIKFLKTKNMAFSSGELPMPLDKPNPLQTWSDFFGQIKGFLRVNGNAYIYLLAPESGINAGKPLAMYVLPSDKVSIILKNDASMLLLENPIDHYILIDGAKYQKFFQNEVVHIKLNNLNFDLNGAHLYGQSPLRAVLDNIQSSNEATSNNIKTMKNGGAFGLIHGKNIPLQEAQAKQLKDRLLQMDNDPGRFGKIAGISTDIGFTRISLTTEELRPFEYLSYDQKQICNALSWSDKLLNSDAGAKYDNIEEAKKEVVSNNIVPDLHLISEAFNTQILPRFGSAYVNSEIYFDVTELPEMQLDIKAMVDWIVIAVKTGLVTRNEARSILRYEPIEVQGMDELTVDNNITTIEDALSIGIVNTQPNEPQGVQTVV